MRYAKYIGYVAFFLFAFVLSLYWTFPWPVAKDFALQTVEKQTGLEIAAETLEPSWVTGIEATGVQIHLDSAEEPIEVSKLEARAHLLPLITGGKGATVDFPIAQGTVHADVVDSADTTEVEADIAGVQIALVPGLADAMGVPLSGKLGLKADMTLNKEKPAESTGTLQIAGDGLELLEGGKVGGMTLPFSLAIGSFDWKIPIEDGKATLKELALSGENGEARVDGTITLNSVFSRSVLNLTLSFKPSDKLLKDQPILGALLNNIRRAKGSDGFYGYALTGSLKHPRFFQKRGR